MATLQRHLQANAAIKLVWFDYWCMPQDERSAEQKLPGSGVEDTRTPAEIEEFLHMLKKVNWLYLGVRAVFCPRQRIRYESLPSME